MAIETERQGKPAELRRAYVALGPRENALFLFLYISNSIIFLKQRERVKQQ